MHTGCRDQFPHITAHTLRRDVLLLGPAAKKFVESATKKVLVWSALRSKDKDYLELMERLRSGSYRHCDDVATIVPPRALPPLPQSDASTSNNGWVASEPLVAPYSAGVCSSCGITTASIFFSSGREGGVASPQTSGGAAGDARTGSDEGEDARQVSYTQAMLLLLLTYRQSRWAASLATLTNTEGRVRGELRQASGESPDRV